MDNAVTILGARGSIPVSGPQFARYGGATTCVLVRLGGHTVVLDAGSGLMNLPGPKQCGFLPEHPEPLPLLISHPHIDHLLGLPLCPYCLKPGGAVDVYMAGRMERGGKELLDGIFRPPYWPVGPAQLPADIRFHPLPDSSEINGIRVDSMEGVHPGGVTVFRLTGGGKRVVFASDCTLTEALLPRLADFAADCDLLLCDGQYSDDEWPARKGFGHSTWTDAARLGAMCRAKQVRLMHHDPGHDDALLDSAAAEVRAICPNCEFAREREEILL